MMLYTEDAQTREFEARHMERQARCNQLFIQKICESNYKLPADLGGCATPSEYYKNQAGWIFDELILPGHHAAFIYAVDNVRKWTYSVSYLRRSLRSRDWSVYGARITNMIRDFFRSAIIEADIYDIIAGNIDAQAAAYLKHALSSPIGYVAEQIAYALDTGDKRLEALLTEIILGETGDIKLNATMIRGIIMSENAAMHELLRKLLLAARLQEGVRQAICENADCGVARAFFCILEVIERENLIRFSSVKRAVGTWLGLMSDDVGGLERVSDKSARLICEYLHNEAARARALLTEDSMRIYIALWAYGFYSVEDALERVRALSQSGTRHQLLTCGYFLANLENPHIAHKLALDIIKSHSGDNEVLALCLPYLLRGGLTNSWDIRIKRLRLGLSVFFASPDEARECFGLLARAHAALDKKVIEFSPCVFPWHTAAVTKSALAAHICHIAALLGERDITERAAEYLREVDADKRALYFEALLSQPSTPAQRAFVIGALCDRERSTRKSALDVVKRLELTDGEYMLIEDMLKYKAEDARAAMILLLCARADDALYLSIHRLLASGNENKRLAALDIIGRLRADDKRGELFKRAIRLAAALKNASVKERVMLSALFPETDTPQAPGEDTLYSEADKYAPTVFDPSFTIKCARTYARYFPDAALPGALRGELSISPGEGEGACHAQAIDDLQALSALIEFNQNEEFISFNGEIRLVGGAAHEFMLKTPSNGAHVPFMDIWRAWYENALKSPERLFSAYIAALAYDASSDFTCAALPDARAAFGGGFETRHDFAFHNHMYVILKALVDEYVPKAELVELAAALGIWFVSALSDARALITYDLPALIAGITRKHAAHLLAHRQLACVISNLVCFDDAQIALVFPVLAATALKCERAADEYARANPLSENPLLFIRMATDTIWTPMLINNAAIGVHYMFSYPSVFAYLLAFERGVISERALYAFCFKPNQLRGALAELSRIIRANESGAESADTNQYRSLADSHGVPSARANSLYTRARAVYDKLLGVILPVELARGDSQTRYSRAISGVKRVRGAKYFASILRALGADAFERASWTSEYSKRENLCHLLAACVPGECDSADTLRAELAGSDIADKRLIEAALYSPEWIDIIGEYLGWRGFRSGCYYFIAHMNEEFSERREAIIARFTPITAENLKLGAVDIDWFRAAYNELGDARFYMIYDAAKYITDGAKHTRARKYSDAALGRLDVSDAEAQITAKRNKDTLMAYALIPLKDDADVMRRYLFIQNFIEQSKKAGAQRAASERVAAGIAFDNLAANAGFSDTSRFTLQMEARCAGDIAPLFEAKDIGGVIVRLDMREDGRVEIICEKGGKPLKSVPASLKKHAHIARLAEAQKALNAQYKRAKRMLEQMMEDERAFTFAELRALNQNPVIGALICALVFISGDNAGFICAEGLIDAEGARAPLSGDALMYIAHPLRLYKRGDWLIYQRALFDRRVKQPFKQVFRELYLKTPEEISASRTPRYAGNQLNPARALACLKSRRWVLNIEYGAQKVYYKENIVAAIHVLADWFSPADIEAPTLEWVEFYNRNTGEALSIGDVPDIIFSEIMRDVDLAVSVAHAGGVDPEASHSTVEMRAALIKCALELFKLTNVEIAGAHARVHGARAEYSVHLGSGVTHQMGGAMLNILPVHSQHRGRLFLPFADDDPKTAEILSKILLLAEDNKLKDPSILYQIT